MGWTQSQHGLIPIPAPATLALIARANAPTVPLDTDKETVTPTGAAIVTALAEGFERPPMTVAGSRLWLRRATDAVAELPPALDRRDRRIATDTIIPFAVGCTRRHHTRTAR